MLIYWLDVPTAFLSLVQATCTKLCGNIAGRWIRLAPSWPMSGDALLFGLYLRKYVGGSDRWHHNVALRQNWHTE
jgi:hypothetical protein